MINSAFATGWDHGGDITSAAASALTTDSTLTPPGITGLAYSLRGLDGAQVVFTTIPTAAAPSDRYRVVWTAQAAGVWAAMAADLRGVTRAC